MRGDGGEFSEGEFSRGGAVDAPLAGPSSSLRAPGYLEFFAGGGMVRCGLGPGWRPLLANDVDPKKAAAYRANWGAGELLEADVQRLETADLPGRPALAWASFPCQDLSLAGPGGGLGGARSGVFWGFHRLMAGLRAEGRAPPLVAIENVCGLYSARGGRDLAALLNALVDLGYRPGALVIDAAAFAPQSRPRLFVIALDAAAAPPEALAAASPDPRWSPPGLVEAAARCPASVRRALVWWRLPPPEQAPRRLADIVEPAAAGWRSPEEVARLKTLCSPRQLSKLARAVAEAASTGRPVYGTMFRRGRPGPEGRTRQRVEWRFDGLAGCLRTPAGGSSRQSLVEVRADGVRVRLFTPREAARLMGLPDSYLLPGTRTDAYRLVGDGVVAPAVAHLRAHLFEPLLGVDAALSADYSSSIAAT